MQILNEDDDNDGFADGIDDCPQGMTGIGNDLDSDGCQDAEDPDIDGDGVSNENDDFDNDQQKILIPTEMGSEIIPMNSLMMLMRL